MTDALLCLLFPHIWSTSNAAGRHISVVGSTELTQIRAFILTIFHSEAALLIVLRFSLTRCIIQPRIYRTQRCFFSTTPSMICIRTSHTCWRRTYTLSTTTLDSATMYIQPL